MSVGGVVLCLCLCVCDLLICLGETHYTRTPTTNLTYESTLGLLITAVLGVEAFTPLTFTRCCHYQYYIANIATKGGRGDIIYCAPVWAMERGGGCPNEGAVLN